MTGIAFDPQRRVSADVRSQVIDAVNRLNLAFDVWDIDTMVAAFTEDSVVHHARGDIKGREALHEFYESYRPLTLGVRRHAMNHVVDGLPDGTIRVMSYNMLVRVAPASDHERLRHAPMLEYDSLPGIYIHAIMTDIFRYETEFGWRICWRTAEQNSINGSLRV